MTTPELAAEVERLSGLLLESLGVRIDEAGDYTYEETLLKRAVEGDSASGPCEICDDNIAAGWIDSEEEYPSGDDGPPFHYGCVCDEEYKESRARVYL